MLPVHWGVDSDTVQGGGGIKGAGGGYRPFQGALNLTQYRSVRRGGCIEMIPHINLERINIPK